MKEATGKGKLRIKQTKSKSVKMAFPEDVIVQLSKSGVLAKAGKNAIHASHELGLSVTVMEDGGIYRLHPDGTRTLIKSVENDVTSVTHINNESGFIPKAMAATCVSKGS